MTETFWKPMGNTHFKTNSRKHHNLVCPYCEKMRKNIMLHYNRYHPETLPKITGEVGQIYGFSIIETKK